MKKNYIHILLILSIALFTACDNDDVDKKNSIFDVEDLQETNKFDEWLYDNYTVPYNIQFDYRFKLMESDLQYHLTPPKIDKAMKFAQLLRYCWLEGYEEVAGVDFVKATSPKEICLVGSHAIDHAGGTSVLGHASGGQRITLFKINNIEEINYSALIGYMHVIHHEFSHILSQKKMMDPKFGQISMANYLEDSWVDAQKLFGERGTTFYREGFVSAYSTSNENEDYAEVFSIYLVDQDPQADGKKWDSILADAEKDGGQGKIIILKKLQMIREYLKKEWNVDIDELKKSVQRRSKNASSIEELPFVDELTK